MFGNSSGTKTIPHPQNKETAPFGCIAGSPHSLQEVFRLLMFFAIFGLG